MSVARSVLVGLMALVLALFPEACNAKRGGKHCTPSSCGKVGNISYPFRLQGDPPECGEPNYELGCENNLTTMSMFDGKLYVQEISYVEQTIRVVDESLDKESCSIPRYSLSRYSFGCLDQYYWQRSNTDVIVFLNCSKPLNSSLYVDFTPCFNISSSSQTKFYATSVDFLLSDVPELCTIEAVAPTLFSKITAHSVFALHHNLLMGFQLSWGLYDGRCSYKIPLGERLLYYLFSLLDFLLPWIGHPNAFAKTIEVLCIGRVSLGLLCLIALVIYKFRLRHLSADDTIEEFLQSHNNFTPIRYSFSEIRDMTKGFEDKLGQGGFGTVYKGKLRSGQLVAVKVLSKLKANGQDFISEVATIGRVYHVNVVRLTGFCVEGSKRALIFDFMANGSLDKFIFHEREHINPLSWETTYEIGIGVARGIEYLHRGCDMQILHFDIKPHNILLDEMFVPKVSDFGLAKLYPIDDSIVSLTVARGTLGYIAPELFYKNIGGISYKADVYSFGMLLMEMVGKRKNFNALTNHSSQIYFPSWIYDRINQGENIELGDANEDEKKLARKMIIVALWCIQLKPVDRPSMSKVLEMLEGNVELLQMPPKPFLCPQEIPDVDHANIMSKELQDVSSYNDIGTITLDVR